MGPLKDGRQRSSTAGIQCDCKHCAASMGKLDQHLNGDAARARCHQNGATALLDQRAAVLQSQSLHGGANSHASSGLRFKRVAAWAWQCPGHRSSHISAGKGCTSPPGQPVTKTSLINTSTSRTLACMHAPPTQHLPCCLLLLAHFEDSQLVVGMLQCLVLGASCTSCRYKLPPRSPCGSTMQQ